MNTIYVCQLSFKNGFMDIQSGRLSAFTSISDLKKAWEADDDAWRVFKTAKTNENGKLGNFRLCMFNENGDLCIAKEVRDPEKGFIRVPGEILYPLN